MYYSFHDFASTLLITIHFVVLLCFLRMATRLDKVHKKQQINKKMVMFMVLLFSLNYFGNESSFNHLEFLYFKFIIRKVTSFLICSML